MYIYMVESQLPWLQTAIYDTHRLDVKMEVTQCTGRISANTRRHQLCWGDQEWATTCHVWVNMSIHVYVQYPFVSSLLSCEFTQTVLLRHTCSIRHCGVTPAGYHRVRSYSIYLALGNVSSLYRIYYGYNSIIYVHVHCACLLYQVETLVFSYFVA